MRIFIIGTKNLQTDLLSYMLKNELDVPCVQKDDIKCLFENETLDDEAKSLLLVDNSENYFEQIFVDLEHYKTNNSTTSYIVALFNLDRQMSIEHDAMRRGVQGFFYKNDRLELFTKGIKTLFSGEIWLSRDILVNMVLHSNIVDISPAQEKAGLTKREMEILALVSMGAKNDEIADKLYISPHTVKTHLYNLFKKINVDNRFQAALWAAQNL